MKACSPLKIPDNGYLLSTGCKQTPGSICTITCSPGYRLTGGDSYHECLTNGTWSGRFGNCQGRFVIISK